jgi:hypothetical protein
VTNGDRILLNGQTLDVVRYRSDRVVEVGIGVARSDIEARGVVVALCRNSTGNVGSCPPLQDATVVRKIDAGRHLHPVQQVSRR